MNNITILIAMKVEPRGLPTWWRCWFGCGGLLPPIMEVLRRNSWVIAMPMLAKEREVRSHARKVRSDAKRND
jgi:hypothetical protein